MKRPKSPQDSGSRESQPFPVRFATVQRGEPWDTLDRLLAKVAETYHVPDFLAPFLYPTPTTPTLED